MAGEENVQVPLNDFVRQIADQTARTAAKAILDEHARGCTIHQANRNVERLFGRVGKMEVRFAAFVGYMVGSGLLGGATGALVGWILR